MRKRCSFGGAYRIIDANLNRSREALRVLEDITRFVTADPGLASAFKSARHRIDSLAGKLPVKKKVLLSARNSSGDFGKPQGYDRARKKDVNEIFAANMKRAQESLRVLEEFAGLVDSGIQADFKELRFSLYALEKTASERF